MCRYFPSYEVVTKTYLGGLNINVPATILTFRNSVDNKISKIIKEISEKFIISSIS